MYVYLYLCDFVCVLYRFPFVSQILMEYSEVFCACFCLGKRIGSQAV